MKKSHCKRGHPLTDESVYLRKDGSRWCRRCGALRGMKYAEKYKGINGPVEPPPENSIWKDIPGFPNYKASNTGYIKNIKTGNLVKQLNKSGYLQICVRDNNNKYKNLLVHRAIMMAFVGLRPGLVVNHINNIKSDNRLENLEWVTITENNQHARKVNGKEKLTREIAESIRKEHAELKKTSRKPTTLLARKYNVHIQTITMVLSRKLWDF